MAYAILSPRSLGEALRMLTYRAKVSHAELAVAAGVSPASISGYLGDHVVPTADRLQRMAEFLASHLAEDGQTLWMELGKLLIAG